MESKVRIRITDIARMAGVSAGTVDRVLHNRGKVAADKKERIEKVLREIGYTPNPVARALAGKKNFNIAVVIPFFQPDSYWELVYQGMQRLAGDLMHLNLVVTYFHFDQHDRGSFAEAGRSAAGGGFDGVIIAALFRGEVLDLSARLDELSIPYVFIDSDIRGAANLAYYGVHSYLSGRIAGRLLLSEAGRDGSIFAAHIRFPHSGISEQMRAREEGIKRYLKEKGFAGKYTDIELDPDDKIACAKILSTSLRQGDVGTVLNSRIYELIPLLNYSGMRAGSEVKLVGFEALKPSLEQVKRREIEYLVSQRPEMQGIEALRAIHDYLLMGKIPPKENFLPIDIIIKENAEHYRY